MVKKIHGSIVMDCNGLKDKCKNLLKYIYNFAGCRALRLSFICTISYRVQEAEMPDSEPGSSFKCRWTAEKMLQIRNTM